MDGLWMTDGPLSMRSAGEQGWPDDAEAARSGFQTGRNEIQTWRNETQVQRNEIQILILPRIEVSQQVISVQAVPSPHRFGQAAENPPTGKGRTAKVHWPALLSEKLKHRFGHLARKCLPKPSAPPIGAPPSHGPRLPFIADLLRDYVGAWTKMLNVGSSNQTLGARPQADSTRGRPVEFARSRLYCFLMASRRGRRD
jgi:hypothetical protein